MNHTNSTGLLAHQDANHLFFINAKSKSIIKNQKKKKIKNQKSKKDGNESESENEKEPYEN